MDREAMETFFRDTYAKLIDEGLTPNEAAAKAMEELQRQVNSSATAQNTSQVSPIATQTEGQAQLSENAPLSEATKDTPDTEMTLENTEASSAAIDDKMDAQEEEETTNGDTRGDADVDMARNSFNEEPTVNHSVVSPPPAPVSVPPALTVPQPSYGEKLKDALYAAGEVDDYREVKKLLYLIFSDLDHINALFASGQDVDQHEEWWGIDRDEMQEVYALLVDALGRSADQAAIQNTWRNALEMLVTQPWNRCSTWTMLSQLRFFLVLFEHPMLFDPDYINVTGGLCKLFYHLTEPAKDLLRAQWNTYFSNDELYRLLQLLQQSITVCLYGSKKMDLVYAACSVLKELHRINAVREPPFATYEEFYNDAVNLEVDIIHDYARSIFFHKKRHAAGDVDNVQIHRMLSEMSFCDFPFVLDAASKSRVLQVDSELEQRASQHDAIASRHVVGSFVPYLILKVRRDNVIEDCLQQLARVSPETLKKPLKVKFVGEEGVDEGGVRKEFFQILLRQLLDPSFGMFKYDEESRAMWFNSDSLESTMEFELIGILLGLAIYNSVILDLHFPHVVYKKLMQCPLDLSDVEVAMPSLGKGLRQLLEFDRNVEDVYQRSFEYSYEVFGAVKTVELKPGGSSIAVTNENRAEYVDLYVDHILNKSIERQYDAFHKGFHMVCNGEVLQMFRYEELQLLICGSTELDFEALQESTHYDDGFTEDSECIKNFWSVVHAFSIEDKRKFLMFCTGSDRVPIRGLSNLVFVISRNGPDSDRLPTAHTCFNHLLLPEYSTREKLKDRLLLAITQSEGFGLR